MKTVILEEPGRFVLSETEKPTRKAGEALVKVHAIGVCGTDLHAFAGKQPFFEYPRILGHELGVEIVDVDENAAGLQVGDRCSVEPYLFDPGSFASKAGNTNCCENMQVLGVHSDGGMRPYFCVPADKLHRCNDLAYEQLALVETLCIGAHAVERGNPAEGETVLVIGAGPIGLGAMQFAMSRGANVVAMDISEERLQFCQKEAAVPHAVNALSKVLEDDLRAIGGGNLPAVIIDATGNKRSMENTFNLAGHGARIVFVGLFVGDVSFDDPSFHRKELTLMASRNALPGTFKEVIAGIQSGKIDTQPWVSAKMALEDVPDKFAGITEIPGLIKAVIEVGE